MERNPRQRRSEYLEEPTYQSNRAQTTKRRGGAFPIIITILVAALCVCCIVGAKYLMEYNHIKKVYAEAAIADDGVKQFAPIMTIPDDDVPAIATPDFISAETQALLDKNSDYIGWIMIDGTSVNYPIVIGNDNQYWLNHNFLTGDWDDWGTFFMDCRCVMVWEERVSVIWGHNMRDNTMFSTLYLYTDKPGYLAEHSNVLIRTNADKYLMYEIFDARQITRGDAIFDALETGADMTAFINAIMTVSDLAGQISPDDKILALVTCTPRGIESERTVVFAKLKK